MNLDNFKSPDVTSMVWHSLSAKTLWEPRLHLIEAEHPRAERRSVLEGIRPACLQTMRKGLDYAQLEAWARNNGLLIFPLRAVGNFSGFADSYSGGDDLFVTIVSRSQRVIEAFRHAQENQRNDGHGDVWSKVSGFLGFPDCCRQFFEQWFPGVSDPIWQWANTDESKTVANVHPSVYTNPLLRYYGVRFAFHIPCSPDCTNSIVFGQKIRTCMRYDVGCWIEELLSQPISVDIYRGISLIKHPLFRIARKGAPAAQRLTINCNSQRMVQINRNELRTTSD